MRVNAAQFRNKQQQFFNVRLLMRACFKAIRHGNVYNYISYQQHPQLLHLWRRRRIMRFLNVLKLTSIWKAITYNNVYSDDFTVAKSLFTNGFGKTLLLQLIWPRQERPKRGQKILISPYIKTKFRRGAPLRSEWCDDEIATSYYIST